MSEPSLLRTRALVSLLFASSLACSTPAPEPAPKPAAAEAPAAPEASAEAPASAPAVADAPSPVTAGELRVDHVVETLEGGELRFTELRGKAVLVVNTASECGFTPQYAKLQELYGRYRDRGLVVVGFPSNDFGGQEPGDAEQIKGFVASEYAVDFPMMAKVHARGPEIAPIYRTLSEETGDGIKGEVKWNFTKFLIDPEGRVVARFEPPVDPMAEDVIKAVEAALPKAG